MRINDQWSDNKNKFMKIKLQNYKFNVLILSLGLNPRILIQSYCCLSLKTKMTMRMMSYCYLSHSLILFYSITALLHFLFIHAWLFIDCLTFQFVEWLDPFTCLHLHQNYLACPKFFAWNLGFLSQSMVPCPCLKQVLSVPWTWRSYSACICRQHRFDTHTYNVRTLDIFDTLQFQIVVMLASYF